MALVVWTRFIVTLHTSKFIVWKEYNVKALVVEERMITSLLLLESISSRGFDRLSGRE